MVLHDEVDGFGTGSAESLPSKSVNPDLDALEEIRCYGLLRRSRPVQNELLTIKPEEIPRKDGFGIKRFYSDNINLLKDDKIDTPHGCWKMPDRGQGWAISDAEMWLGWKKTFVYKPAQPSKSNETWHMDVYALIDDNNYVKPLYLCHVFEVTNSYDPRPQCVSLLYHAGLDPSPIQEDPVEVESLAKQLEAIANNPNLFPYVEHQDYKKEKFVKIKARCPDGKEIKWSICNHCGMVYKGIPNKAVRDNHKCRCGCNLASNR